MNNDEDSVPDPKCQKQGGTTIGDEDITSMIQHQIILLE